MDPQLSEALQRVLLPEGPATSAGGEDRAEAFHALLLRQQEDWEMLRRNYAGLTEVVTKSFTIDGSVVKVQFNPKRITSSAAKVDAASIKARPCFLCPMNLPPEQRGLAYRGEYVVLCNPFPILREHFTIPHREHRPQRIAETFPVLRDLARDVGSRYTAFYNGPQCGASAPDHLHFQAGEKGFMPIEEECDRLVASRGELLADRAGLRVVAMRRFLRPFIMLESGDGARLADAFQRFITVAGEVMPPAEEPMMNLLLSYANGRWRALIFPRRTHRPSFFFAEGDRKVLLSPAAVDVAGVLTTPLEADFRKMNEELIVQMFREVMLPEDVMERLTSRLGDAFT